MNGIRPMVEFQRFIDDEYNPFKHRVGFDFQKVAATDSRNFEAWMMAKALFRVLHYIPFFGYLYRKMVDKVLAEVTARSVELRAAAQKKAEEQAKKPDLAVPEKSEIVIPGR